MSYKVNNVYIPNRKNQQQVPSHIDTHEVCSSSSNLYIPTLTLPTVKLNKVDQFLKTFQTKTSKHEDISISSLD